MSGPQAMLSLTNTTSISVWCLQLLPSAPFLSNKASQSGYSLETCGFHGLRGHFKPEGTSGGHLVQPSFQSRVNLQIKMRFLGLHLAQVKVAPNLSGQPSPSQTEIFFMFLRQTSLILPRCTGSDLGLPHQHIWVQEHRVRFILRETQTLDLDLRCLPSVMKKQVLLKVSCLPLLFPNCRGSSHQRSYLTARGKIPSHVQRFQSRSNERKTPNTLACLRAECGQRHNSGRLLSNF